MLPRPSFTDLFKRCPEPMYEALTLHNNVIRRAKYANCGSTVQQEGDSYTLVREPRRPCSGTWVT